MIVPKKWQKNYEKIHAENEDMYSYKFYDDHVEVKTPSLSANFKYELAEGVVETKDILILYFTLKRCFMIDKNQCSEEQLDFIRSIVPEEKQRKSNRKKLPKFILKVVYLTVVSVFLGYMIVCYNYIRNNTYYLKYRCTTYQSFLDCLEHGTIEDVLIIKDKYVEYTYTGKGKHERYYTVSDDTDTLIDLLEEGDVSWKTKRAVYCK